MFPPPASHIEEKGNSEVETVVFTWTRTSIGPKVRRIIGGIRTKSLEIAVFGTM